MAVLIEAISVNVRRDAIESKYSGGWEAFVDAVPNSTLCADNEIARVGFLAPSDVEAFVKKMQHEGLQFIDDGKAIDLAVADQQRGLTTPCDWLEFGKLRFGENGKVSACWFFSGARIATGTHMHGTSMQLATPPGWEFDGSMSQKFGFITTSQE